MHTEKNFFVDFEVRFGKALLSIEMPSSATVGDLKQTLEAQTHVRAEKQRLLLNLPVTKDKQRDPGQALALRELFSAALVEQCEHHEGSTPQHLKVSAMLLGSVEVASTVNVAATTEISRLVATTVEHDGKWYRCSYSKGYLRQTAYVCRTCVEEGRADAQHTICLACAEFCHGNHDVEEWGVRYHMRCDCCTERCWRPVKAVGVDAMPAIVHAEELNVIHTAALEHRTRRKRSRSSSPLTPKRSRGGSPMSGIRMTTIPPAEMPELELQAMPIAVAEGQQPSDHAAPAVSKPSVSTAAESGFPTSPLVSSSEVPRPLATAAEEATPRGSGASFEDDIDRSQAKPTITTEECNEDAPPPLPQLGRCAFVIDSKTKMAPVESLLPRNRYNRYPRDPLNWCYCKNPHPSDDPDCGGIACLLCASCYWSTHVTRLFTGQYRRMPCYGDVLVGDTVAFKCNTCSTYVCTPCRYRCHKDHDIVFGPVLPSHDDGSDNGAIAGGTFSCGCRGLCAIAENVPEDLIDDATSYNLISDADAVELLNDDIFTGFVCAMCMQEHPWLATDDPFMCYRGELPPKVLTKRPVLACGSKPTGPPASLEEMAEAETFPYHGMLLPVNAFTPDTTCSCAPCRAAYEKFAPRAMEDALEMVMQLHDQCDNCGKSVKDQQAFMCRTCELNGDATFFICKDCNAQRAMRASHQHRIQAAPATTNGSTTTATGQPDGQTEGSGGNTSSSVQPPEEGDEQSYTHDMSHEFIEDTFENLYALCGMQMMQHVAPELRESFADAWNPVVDQADMANTLSQTLGQLPLQFNEEELQDMASLNQSHGRLGDSPSK